ncbi:MAG: hypothetical protein IJP75_06410 [Bacteroidaceae bacterium]|nr:hypothetical protein [Bacteroidaceae bacterium]
MKKNLNVLRGRPWLVLLALFAWLLPQTAAADLSYEDDPDNYTVELGGSNVIYFTAPCYDTSGADTWIYDGNLRVSVDGADPITIFHWESKTDIDNDKTTLPVNFTTTADGFFDITLGNSRNTFRLTKNNGGWKDVVRNSDGKTFGFSAEWAVPYNLLGKKLRFTWYVKRNGNSATVLDRQVPGLQAKEISMPAASAKLEPFVSLPMLSANNPGKLEIPWFLASDSIVSAHYEYTDDTGKRHEEKIEKVKSSSILLDANVPYRNFRVVCSYKEASDKGSYLIENQGSAVQNIPVIHTPVGVTARQLDGQNLKVEVKWNITYPDDEDLTPTDFFEVQRSITGEEKDFVTIQQLPYISVSKQSTYTFVDNTLMDDITPDMLVNGGTLDKLTYRVRRTITKDWNWAKNSCFASTKCVVDNLHLLRIKNYSAKWEDKNAYTVHVSWNYADEHGAVWDERAQMVLRVAMKNRDGQPVDTQVYTLDQNDRAQCYKIISLSRSCVNYDIEMYVEQGESPLNYIIPTTENGYFNIKSAEDWKTFRDMVEAAKGQYDVNARLYANISTDLSIGWGEDIAYRGTFDGNGHTLTFNNTSHSSNDFVALFRYAKDYTIQNLHLTGNVKGGIHSAGLVGHSDASEGGRNTIQNCRVSVNVESTKTHAGGIVGHGLEAAHTITDCLFDGSIKCSSGNSAGAIIGWSNKNDGDMVTNCLEKGTYTNIKNLGMNFTHGVGAWGNGDHGSNNWTSHNWAEASQVGSRSAAELIEELGSSNWVTDNGTVVPKTNTITGITNFFFPIRSYDDWVAFRDKVQAAKGQYDVNARLYADVNAGTIMVGWEQEYSYRGIFDGNGHTLTFSVNDHGVENLAPFKYVGNATIRNLRTAGTINNDHKFSAGLIANVLPNSTVSIENCRSSMALNCSVDGDATNGGFVAVVHVDANVTFLNCKFDGSFQGANSSHNGGYVGYTNGPVTIENCLFAPASINTKSEGSETWARVGIGSLNVINSYATRDFTALVVIRNANDWTTFRDMVEKAKGQYDVNAILAADISSNTSAGDEAYPYRGTFDGNGHTLTINISHNSSCQAPFRYASNATFRNLRTAGTLTVGGMFNGGLIGEVIAGSTVNIENCHSSMTINCSLSGDGTNGGFIGHIMVTDAKVTFRNCKFDGSFEGANSSCNGGFVGWSSSPITFVNCLFTPASVKTDPYDSDTWARGGNYTTSNCYATKEFIHVINNFSDWEEFRKAVDSRGNHSVNAILNADISANTSINNFKGMFDGNAHSIEMSCPMFNSADGYTIKNLHVKGGYGGNQHVAGLVVSSLNANIQSCWVSTSIHCNTTHAGGFIGHAQDSPQTINNCLFDGAISTKNDGKNDGTSYVGAFIGWGGGADNHVTNCLEDGNYYYVDHAGFCYKGSGSAWGNTGNSKNNYTYKGVSWNEVNYAGIRHNNINYVVEKLGSGWYADGDKALPKMTRRDLWNNVGSLSASDLASKLGPDWKVDGNKVVPVMSTTSVTETDFEQYFTFGWTKEDDELVPETTTVEEPVYTEITKPTLPNFYHKNTGTIDKTLVTTTRQSSVLLAWNTDGNPIDYFTVMRRVKGQGDDAWKEIATFLDDMSYEDTSVSPLATYEYKVLGVNDCEGRDSTATEVKVGECKHTGRVDGYVRFNDGTSAAGIQVDINYKGKKVMSVFTDDSGHFVADELSYQGGASVTYDVSAVGKNGEDFSPKGFSVTFDAHSNDETLREISILNGKRFSGYVMYDGTSIPVKGANFKVNGKKVYNTKGKLLETEYDGSFSFRVLPGNDTIQVVMDGHNFTNDGYFKGATGHNFTDDVAGIYFYDATKVKLAGRVVGGEEQGQKPLGNNLSTNNLGDSLTIVLTLEGDNTSWLVYDNLNPNKTEREEVVRHQRNGNKHFTSVKTQRKRMTVWPDPTTGEYELLLPPVRWKVQQVYCTGYPTLFQEGQVSEVIDLTDCLTPNTITYTGSYKDVDTITVKDPKLTYNAIYNRIYRAPVEVTYKQLGYDSFDYFGDKNYYASELTGETVEVPLAFPNPADTTKAVYSFTYPVFSIDRKYTIELQVGENYLYNNDPAGKVDIVRLGGGMAMMQNGMNPGSYDEPVAIDSLGRARFTVQASQTTNMKNSLKTVTFTVMRDGTFLEAKPLQGYVLNMFPVGESTELLTDGQPLLFDILRDPPGSYSSNTLAKGATLNYSYMMNLTLMAGIMITYKDGKKLQTLSATVVAPQGSGTAVGPISAGETQEGSIDQFIYSAQGSKAFSYTMAIGNNISTSGDPSMVGADADLYIGAVQNVVVTPMSTVRAVNKKMFDQIAGRQGGINKASEMTKDIDYGTVVKIAEGCDANGDSIYLIRDVALGYGPKIQSQFIYSQKQILTQIIPNKAKEIVDMMFCGTKDEAQAIADRTGKPVYWSLREPKDSMFAVVNKQLSDRAYNYNIDKAEKGINYMVVIPNGTSPDQFNDEVTEKYQIIKAWTEMIAQNEYEKLQASDLLTNYDIAGAQGVNYSETFDSNFSNSWTHHFPVATEVDYFGPGISYATSAFSIGATIVGSILASMEEMKYWKSPGVATSKVDISKDDGWNASLDFAGKLSQWTITPVALYQTVGANSEAKAFNRTESFTIATDPMSRLSVDVYRVKPLYEYDKSGSLVHNMINPRYIANDSVGVTNIFTNYQFEKMTDLVTDFVGKEAREDGLTGPRGFVFRTRGGATQNPWEDQRTTKFYETGRELDARTLKIVNPKIRLDKQDVSGVSINDAAHFKVYVSNESEKPEATEGLTVLQLFSVDQTNTNGAKISVNGQTLTTGGMTISVVPGSETELDMEVRAGQGFDFMGLTIGVMSPTDAVNTKELVSFNVHYLHEAGGLAIAVPGDKWVLNTNAQMDSKRGWYLPVTINGFDRHQHNFDHIEFQYKESQRGDDSWTNICSFYADPTLMANANGVRKLIPENGNIVTEFFGESWVIERSYDLRAVLFCRNGSDFLTTSSKIISGIKDTRRPQLFGTPEPKSGLLTNGDDIVFNFSEDIEYNYLSAITNFEVKGEVNNNSLSEMVSVQFAGKASVESEAKRNFSGKDLTIDMRVKPAETGRDMPLFSHGTNGQNLQLWLTSDFMLKAVVNNQTFTSDEAIVKKGFTQVAVSINQTDSTLTFFNGGVEIGRNKLNALYYGTGPLIFGRTNELDRNESLYYEGRMMEARLWYAAMDGGLIGTTYGGRRLTGYERNLVDYYPMNEGSGDYVIDHTQGANAKLMGASWAIPRGLSLHLEKADKGVLLDKNAMNRTSEHDYTLMFWFKTDADGRGALLSNGRGLREDIGAENLFHIGFEGDKLMYRTNGFEAEVPGDWSDGQWHNFAMTVNRARNVANIYMDQELRTTFEADSIGGISGGYPLIGATRYDVVKENGDVEVMDDDDALTGNVDELLFFAQALPQELINTYAKKSPNGDEAGLLTYLAFDRTERQKDNDLELVPYAYSKKIYLDDKGEPRYQLDPLTKEPTGTLVRDYLFVDEEDVVLTHFDQTQAAPVVPYEEVKNLKFGFIGRGNQLMVELDENAARLNHRNIYVTVRDIEDKNGNTMASPQTACYYVTNSSLQWLLNRADYTIKYGTGENAGEELTLPFYNHGSISHTYTIENCPKWLKLDKYTDVVAPQFLDGVEAVISKDLNIGTYNEIIYLTDEEGITEPFYFNLTVEGDKPDWAQNVSGDLLQNSMNISGQVYLYDELDTDARDIVGVFDNENVCHGYANISHDAQTGETALYLTVYDNQTSGRELNFRLWQYSTGREILLTPEDSIKFQKDAMLGSNKPVRFDGSDAFVQNFKLSKGWNWVSFNVNSEQLKDVNKLLSSMPWSDGDILTELGSNMTLTYEKAQKQWLASGSTANMEISPKKAYAIMVHEDCTFPIGGTVISEKDARTITLNKGWNAIGYTPMTNLTVETALSDYYDEAEPGDVIKSHTEFAYFTKAGNSGRWRGSLQYMKPGEGYLMLRKGATSASFAYPYYEMGSSFREDWSQTTNRSAVALANKRSTMSVSATVEGFDTEEGDRLVAYANGETVGEAVMTADGETQPAGGLFYLSIGGDGQQPIWFAIERDGEIVASSGEIMTFKTNDVIGTPDEPTAISFVQAIYENGKWYTLSGVQLPKKPTQRGIYIFNRKKIVVK